MANLSQDLNSYLTSSKNSASSTSSKLSEGGEKIFGWAKSATGLKNGSSASDSSGKKGWFSFGSQEQQPDPWCPKLSKTQRIMGFITCIVLGAVCFVLACMYIPLLLFKARKFALLYSFGSLFTLASFSFLWGPYNHLKHLFSKDRLPFTAAYLGTLFGTLYFAMHLQSTILTSVCAVAQMLALLWYLISYIPGGTAGLKFFTSMCFSMCSKKNDQILPM